MAEPVIFLESDGDAADYAAVFHCVIASFADLFR